MQAITSYDPTAVSVTYLPPGLPNPLNNCWMNTFLQMIFFTPSFLEIYNTDAAANETVGNDLIGLRDAYQKAHIEGGEIDPQRVIKAHNAFCRLFHGISPKGRQEDLHDAISQMLTLFQEIKGNTPIQNPLFFKEKTITYGRVGTSSEIVLLLEEEQQRFEISLPLPSPQIINEKGFLFNTQKTLLPPPQSLHTLLENHFAANCEQDDPYWRGTQQVQPLHKKRILSSAPGELLVTLQRFYTYRNSFNQITIGKNSTIISTPLTLKLPQVNKEYQLDFIGIHIGENVDSGHYIAYKKIHDLWIKCNDKIIEPVEEREIQQVLQGKIEKTTPYVLHFSSRESDAELLNQLGVQLASENYSDQHLIQQIATMRHEQPKGCVEEFCRRVAEMQEEHRQQGKQPPGLRSSQGLTILQQLYESIR